MKTKSLILLAVGINLLFLAACSKADSDKFGTADPNAKQHNQDVSDVKSESDNVNTDVNNIINNMKVFGKNEALEAISICGATIDSSQQNAATPTIIITFDGTTVCTNPSRIRSGQIKVELIAGNKWTDVGAKLRVTHTDYKITFPTLNNHYITFSGVKYLTDVNGINWLSIYQGGTAQLRERCYNMQVTFDNGQTASWSSARLSTWGVRNNLTEVYATVNGDTTINGKTIDSWGITRWGTSFTTEMIAPWQSNSTCGWWRPISGKYTSTTDNFSITATFGVDQSGNQSSGCNAYGFKLEWVLVSPSASGQSIISYL